MISPTGVSVLMPALMLAAPVFGAQTFYVSTAGDDPCDGSSLDTAFRTIQRGVKPLQPGDTLLVAPGVYREQVISNGCSMAASHKTETLRKAGLPGKIRSVGRHVSAQPC